MTTEYYKTTSYDFCSRLRITTARHGVQLRRPDNAQQQTDLGNVNNNQQTVKQLTMFQFNQASSAQNFTITSQRRPFKRTKKPLKDCRSSVDWTHFARNCSRLNGIAKSFSSSRSCPRNCSHPRRCRESIINPMPKSPG